MESSSILRFKSIKSLGVQIRKQSECQEIERMQTISQNWQDF